MPIRGPMTGTESTERYRVAYGFWGSYFLESLASFLHFFIYYYQYFYSVKKKKQLVFLNVFEKNKDDN